MSDPERNEKAIISGSADDQDTSSNEIVTLDVGGRKFKTLKQTLTAESSFFVALFSPGRRWGFEAQKDGSFFIDIEPEIFEHILRYLRQGTYPCLYDKENGFDVVKYTWIQHAAEYLGIDKLARWIEGKVYETGVERNFQSQSFERNRKGAFPGLDDFVNDHKLGSFRFETGFNDFGTVTNIVVAGETRTIRPAVFKGAPPSYHAAGSRK